MLKGKRALGIHPSVILKPLAIAIAAILLSCQAASAQPPPVRKEHAYEGARRPPAQLATVFGRMLTQPLALTNICEADGKSYRRTFAVSVCVSVMYLLPGQHRLVYNHGTGYRGGSGTLNVRVEAGRVYEIEAEATGGSFAVARLKEMPRGFVLTYKDVMPSAFTGSRQNSAINPAAD